MGGIAQTRFTRKELTRNVTVFLATHRDTSHVPPAVSSETQLHTHTPRHTQTHTGGTAASLESFFMLVMATTW